MTRRKMPLARKETADTFVTVGLDAEWVLESVGKNLILSYQFSVINADNGTMTKLIIYPKGGKRITLENGLTRAMLKACKEGVIDQVPHRFIISAHFTRADLTTFANFGLFKRGIGAVRKSYATTERPLQLQLASNQGPVRCSAMVVDTMLLSPAGTSLEKLGKLLGVPKIELPAGYSKDRMDVFLRDCPAKFEEYAITDAVIPALWVTRIYSLLLDRLGIKKKVVTLGGAAVELVKREAKACDINLRRFLGQDDKKRPLAHLVPMIATAAQAYHGGYNVACSLGFSPAGKQLTDFDIKSAYTTALAFIGVPDWHNARQCVRLEELAVIDGAMTVALVEFRFPDGTRFPCLPIRASNKRGLVHPLEGSSWATGPELVVATMQGAVIRVRDGYRVDWRHNSVRLFEDITRLIGAIRAEAKARDPPDIVLDKLVKEMGNSIYGKIAQGVAGTRIVKDDIDQQKVFNTLFGISDNLGPSAITNATMAAYCTGLVRALLLETIGRLPGETWVGTATTDGFLSTCTMEDIDQSGPVAAAFKAARERITPDDDTIWEVKHVVPGAVVTKTRGTYTVVPEGWNGGSVVLAKAGYRTPEAACENNEIEQSRMWLECYRAREYETTLQAKSLTPLRVQHLLEEDIQMVTRKVKWNADFDMKRKLVKVRDVNGLITADTVPWRNIDEFEQARDLLEDWKESQRRVLKTKLDYDDMLAWGKMRANRKGTGTRSHNKLSSMPAAVLKMLAWRDTPISEWIRVVTAEQKANWMTAICGVKVTDSDIKNAKRRGARPEDLTGSITELCDDDRRFLEVWFGFSPIVPDATDMVWNLCKPGSTAEMELDELFEDIATGTATGSRRIADVANRLGLCEQEIHASALKRDRRIFSRPVFGEIRHSRANDTSQ